MNQKTIGIFTCKVPGLNPWDPESIHTGISGSEEAVIYISQKLAKLGLKVIVFADSPMHSSHSAVDANPRFVDLEFHLSENLDVAISWRMPQFGKLFKKVARKVFLWPSDVLPQPVPLEMVEAFDDVLWLSQWQREQWISITPAFSKYTSIFGNGINPEDFFEVYVRENPYSCIYGSNYARGLEILLDIWPVIERQYPRATLDIYYGWQHWGCLSREKEIRMRQILSSLKNVKDHGLVGHAELNRAYERASFWTYPCIMPETFCITALRAQMGGAIPIIIEGSALKETVPYGYRCFRPEEYLATLLKAMGRAESITLNERKRMSEFVCQKFTWEKIARRWVSLMFAKD